MAFRFVFMCALVIAIARATEVVDADLAPEESLAPTPEDLEHSAKAAVVAQATAETLAQLKHRHT